MVTKDASVNVKDIPKIIGSVNVRDAVKNLFSENVKTSFIKGVQTAQDQIFNGIVLGGQIGFTQGFLTYTYYVVDHTNGRAHIVIIDTGTGEVLHTVQDKHTRLRHESVFDPFGHDVGPFGMVDGYIPI